jgi:hypothetical protein
MDSPVHLDDEPVVTVIWRDDRAGIRRALTLRNRRGLVTAQEGVPALHPHRVGDSGILLLTDSPIQGGHSPPPVEHLPSRVRHAETPFALLVFTAPERG